MKYLQDNKDNSMLIDYQLDRLLSIKLIEPLYRRVNNPRRNRFYEQLNNRLYTKLRIELNSIIRCYI